MLHNMRAPREQMYMITVPTEISSYHGYCLCGAAFPLSASAAAPNRISIRKLIDSYIQFNKTVSVMHVKLALMPSSNLTFILLSASLYICSLFSHY